MYLLLATSSAGGMPKRALHNPHLFNDLGISKGPFLPQGGTLFCNGTTQNQHLERHENEIFHQTVNSRDRWLSLDLWDFAN